MSDRYSTKAKLVTISTRPRTSTSDSSEGSSTIAPSLKSPRAARFAEATAVHSPVDGPAPGRLPFAATPPTPTNHFMAQPQVSDVGFGYVGNKHESVEMPDTETNEYPGLPPKSPMKSPLKSAMRTPGAPPREGMAAAIFSPTFKEEEILEKREKLTEREQARDLKIKVRVRMAKLLMRGVNFSCSLIVLSMLATTFNIFNATKTIPARNNLPPWAPAQKVWPQITLLSIACFSLFASILIFWGYYRGGHKRAQKAAVWYNLYAVGFFIFSIVMWAIGVGVLQGSRTTSGGQDMWGWACKENTRKSLFENEVDYNLICRLQSWSLMCAIIEIIVEIITIAVYAVVFHRIWSKRKLRKSMAHRDRARSDLYSAQLRSAPQTPGTAVFPSEYFANAPDIEAGHYYHHQYASPVSPSPVAFVLQPPPIRVTGATPDMQQLGFQPLDLGTPTTVGGPLTSYPPNHPSAYILPDPSEDVAPETQQDHFAPAPGEQVYASVPIPGAYEPPVSPGAEGGREMHFPH